MAISGSAQEANASSSRQNTLEFAMTLISAKVDRVYSINLD